MTPASDRGEEARHPRAGRRSAARLAAVQALYQIEMSGQDPESAILEFRTHRPGATIGGGEAEMLEADLELFADLVRGVARRTREIDEVLARMLPEKWPVARLETVLRGILRLGVYELRMRRDVPARVIINEYMEVAHAFFMGDEPGMVNAILDRLARRLRPEEMDG